MNYVYLNLLFTLLNRVVNTSYPLLATTPDSLVPSAPLLVL